MSSRKRPATAAKPAGGPPGKATRKAGSASASAVGPAVVVGPVSPLARLAGGFAIASALCWLVAPAFPLAVRRGGSGVGGAVNAFDFVPALVAALVLGAAGLSCLRGTLPRLGLGAIGTFGSASLGLLLQSLYLYGSGVRTSRDLPLPVAMVLRSFRYDVAGGLHVQVAAEVLAVAALALVLLAWPRSWMEDDGSFDQHRPVFGGLGLFVGFSASAGVCLAYGDSATPAIGPQSLLGRTGLDLWGTALLAVALLLGGVVAASLRPRLAAAGGFAGLAAVTANYALHAVLVVARSTALHTSVGGVALCASAVGFALLAAWAWQISPVPTGTDDRSVRRSGRYAPGGAVRTGQTTDRRGVARRSGTRDAHG